MAADDDPAAQHPLTRALAQVADGIDAGLEASLVAMPQVRVRARLLELEVQERRLHALRLRLVAASAALDPPLGSTGGAGVARRGGGGVGRTGAWMRSRLHVTAGRAAGELRAAALLDQHTGELRELGHALGEGRTSAEHVRGACRAVTRIPTHLIRAHRETFSQQLTEHATTWAPREADVLAGHLLAVVDPDGSDRYDPAALERRSLSISTDSTGMVITRGQHDPAAGAFLKTAIDLLASYHRTPHNPDGPDDPDDPEGADGAATVGGTTAIKDRRAGTQRRHDALDDLVRAGVAHLATCHAGDGIGAAMSRLIITTTTDQLAAVTAARRPPSASHSRGGETGDENDRTPDGRTADPAERRRVLDTRAPGSATCIGHGPISPGFLQLAACDAVIDRVLLDTHGAVVSMTTQSRYATPAMTRALIARDGGCATPGCPAPPSLTHAHHVTWWSRGGPTCIENLVLLCARHHRAVHADQMHVTIRDGIPWFRHPNPDDPGKPGHPDHADDADDPDAHWTRGTFADAATRARQLAQHLAADEHSHRHHRWWLRDEEPA